MKQCSGNKSASTGVIIALSAIALIGFSAVAIHKSRSARRQYGPKRQSGNTLAVIGRRVEVLSEENAALRDSLELLADSMNDLTRQNEQLTKANNELTKAFKEEHERVIKLMDLVTVENEEKLVLVRKLEEASSRLSALERPQEEKAKEFIA